jgi:putative oxidoreductase
MKKFLFATNDSYAPTILRLLLGTVMFAHGAQKMLGWFGGYGFEGTMGFFTGAAGLPWIVGFLVILIEFFGALLLILGFATRLWSISMFFLFIGITITSHLSNGFFMNWFGNQKGEGIEFFLLAIGMAASITISGAGKLSIDRLLSQKTSVKNNVVNKGSFREAKPQVA